MIRRAALLLIMLAVRPALAEDDATDLRPLFRQGAVELSVGGGYGTFNDRGYLVVLLGGAYYLRDGLSAGATGEAWTGSHPQVYSVSPQVRYVCLDSTWRYKPYLGAFYRRTAYSRGLEPLDSGGARAGLVVPLSARAYLAAGAVYEHYFRCDRGVYSSCDSLYPELDLSFTF